MSAKIYRYIILNFSYSGLTFINEFESYEVWKVFISFDEAKRKYDELKEIGDVKLISVDNDYNLIKEIN